MDEETQRLIEIRRDKERRLHILDKQATAFGRFFTPPHIEMERVSLREELGMVETAITSPARAEIGDELGASGRFLVYHQQNREIRQSIAALAVQFEKFTESSMEWRAMHRTWIIILALVALITLIAVVIISTYIIARGGL